MQTREENSIRFVARPELAPPTQEYHYARPDDASDESGLSWRARVLIYNSTPGANELGLLETYRLYEPQIYQSLASFVGIPNLFILSAGWGLVRADFLLPYYDITFSKQADEYKVRRNTDHYADFCQLPEGDTAPILFFGGKDYLPLFASLTSRYRREKIVFYNSAIAPSHAEWRVRRFQTSRRTNWHYECAQAYIAGQLKD